MCASTARCAASCLSSASASSGSFSGLAYQGWARIPSTVILLLGSTSKILFKRSRASAGSAPMLAARKGESLHARAVSCSHRSSSASSSDVTSFLLYSKGKAPRSTTQRKTPADQMSEERASYPKRFCCCCCCSPPALAPPLPLNAGRFSSEGGGCSSSGLMYSAVPMWRV